MAQLNQNFDATAVEPSDAFTPLPPGWYTGIITDSEMKETKAMTGNYLQLTIAVQDKHHFGRVVFERLNIDNPNQTSVDIAQRTLSALCRAVGVLQISDSNQLHGLPFEFKLSIKPASGQYEASNNIKGYRKATNGGAAGTPQQTQAPAAPPAQQQAAPAPSGAAPWDSANAQAT